MAGTAAASTSAAQPLARASSCRWPSSPKPVTSVTACAPAARAARAAGPFSVHMTSTASSTPGPAPRLAALVSAPVPSGFVRTSTSPARPPAVVRTSSGWTVPVTAIPYFGSASSIECPPTTATPAAAAASPPPRRISRRTSAPSDSSGNATRFSADSGSPPMAQTSERAFVAAIRPNRYGSSTIGVKKSTVVTSARSSRTRTTPASSAPAAPTSTRGSLGRGSSRTSSWTADAGNLQPQPAPCESEVRVTPMRSMIANLPRVEYTADEVDRAIDAVSDPERLQHAQDVVTHLAPQLQRILATALDEGGYFGNAHEAELRRILEEGDAPGLRTFVAEETRLGMLVGTAIGFELAHQLQTQREDP